MGLAGAAAVAVAVAIAVTLVPATARAWRGSGCGRDARPGSAGSRGRRGPLGLAGHPPAGADHGRRGRRAAGPRASPPSRLRLGLPDNGSAEAGSSERVTYDLIASEYGAGFNSPLLVTADIIRTTDPVGVMEKIGRDIERIDGV